MANEASVPAVSAPDFPDAQLKTSPDAQLKTASLRGTNADWTGFQAGVILGYSKVNDSIGDQAKGDMAGIFAAYNHQIGKAVIGVEAEHMDLDNRFTGVFPVMMKTLSNVKLRGGIAFDRVLVYGTAGFSYSDIEMFGKDWGYLFGGGVDYMLSDHLVVGGQYTHHVFKGYNGYPIDGEADVAMFRAAFMF